MRHLKVILVTLASVALLLEAGTGWAAPTAPRAPDPARWEELVEPQAASIFIRNLSERPAEATVGSQAVFLGVGGTAEIPASRLDSSSLRLRSMSGLLILQASEGFEAATLEVEPGIGKPAARTSFPDWVRTLTIARGARLRHGVTGAVEVSADDPAARLEVAVDLLTPHTSVRVRQLDVQGNEVASLVASASRPVRWRAFLGTVDGTSRVEMTTLRGESQGTAAAVVPGIDKTAVKVQRARILPPPTAKSGGLAQFSPEINWSGNLDYYITGAPASLWGNLYVSRNFGAYTMSPNWIQTDSSGNAHAGPWSYANQSGDEEAYAYIIWSNSLSTNTAHHIWDKTEPTAAVTSSGGPPAPTSFYGTANDPSYGAGFDSSWADCYTYFYDSTTDDYWSSGGSYNNAQFPVGIPCTLSGMPSRSVTWSQSTLPPGYAHISHHCYEWGVYVWDGGHQSFRTTNSYISFCIP